MATTTLALPTLPTTTEGRDERIVSEAWNLLDQRVSDREDILVVSDANITLTGGTTRQADTGWRLLRVRDDTTILTATRTLVLPTFPYGAWVVQNLTAQTINVTASGGSISTVVVAGAATELFGDGLDLIELGDSTDGSGAITNETDYLVKFNIDGQPANLVEYMRMVSVRDLVLPAGTTTDAAVCVTGSTANATFRVFIGNFEVASILFTTGSLTGTITVSTQVPFGVGEILSVRAPGPKDTTLSDIGISIPFLRV